jgi:hypothetical protein
MAWDAFRHEYESVGDEWWKFNLERFLAEHPLAPDSMLYQQIVGKTAEAFKEPHGALREALEENPVVTFPLCDMLSKLLKSTPATRPWLSVITPNYDLVVEYTSDLIGAPCMTGFSGRIIRKWMPQIGFIQSLLQNVSFAHFECGNTRILTARQVVFIRQPHCCHYRDMHHKNEDVSNLSFSHCLLKAIHLSSNLRRVFRLPTQ